jgi:hypothetical protein
LNHATTRRLHNRALAAAEGFVAGRTDNRDLLLLRSLALPPRYTLLDDAAAHDAKACRVWLAETRLRLRVAAGVAAGASSRDELEQALAAYQAHQGQVDEALAAHPGMPLLGPGPDMLGARGRECRAAMLALGRAAAAYAGPGVWPSWSTNTARAILYLYLLYCGAHTLTPCRCCRGRGGCDAECDCDA